MEHPTHPGELADGLQAVGVGIPVVDDDRQVQLLRQGELIPEYPLLMLPGRVFLPVVVQPDFPDGNHLWLLCQRLYGLQLRRFIIRAVLRVKPHGGIEEGETPGQFHRGLRAGDVAARVHHQGDPSLRQARQRCLPVRVELLRVIVGMGVKKHQETSLKTGRPAARSLL